MANEKRLIPFLGEECARMISPFGLRLLILFYYAAMLLSVPIMDSYNTSDNVGVFLFVWAVGYWIAVYLVAYLLTWLFTGNTPGKR